MLGTTIIWPAVRRPDSPRPDNLAQTAGRNAMKVHPQEGVSPDGLAPLVGRPSALSGAPATMNSLVDGLDGLVSQACAGLPGAMTELIKRFTPLVRAVVRRAGVYGAEAEDVEQETWLRLTTHLHQVREPAALPRWLSVTAGRLCFSLFDKRRRTVPVGDFSEDVWMNSERWSDPAEDVCQRDEMGRLNAAIEGLNPRDRTLVRMLLAAASYREISAGISMPVGSIGPTRERVLRKLASSPLLRSPQPGSALASAA